MLNTIRAVVKEGKIEFLEKVEIADGTEVLVTVLSDEEDFWSQASQTSLDKIWDNQEGDVYAELLEEWSYLSTIFPCCRIAATVNYGNHHLTIYFW